MVLVKGILSDFVKEYCGYYERNTHNSAYMNIINQCSAYEVLLWIISWNRLIPTGFCYPKRCSKFHLLKLQKYQGAADRPVLNSLFSIDLIVNCTTFFIHYVYHGKWWSNNLHYTLADWHHVLLEILNCCHGKIGYVQHFAKSLLWIVYRFFSHDKFERVNCIILFICFCNIIVFFEAESNKVWFLYFTVANIWNFVYILFEHFFVLQHPKTMGNNGFDDMFCDILVHTFLESRIETSQGLNHHCNSLFLYNIYHGKFDGKNSVTLLIFIFWHIIILLLKVHIWYLTCGKSKLCSHIQVYVVIWRNYILVYYPLWIWKFHHPTQVGNFSISNSG